MSAVSERFGYPADDTERPEPGGAAAALPTVAEVLALPVFAQARAEVLAGAAQLGAPVRWVHVSDSAGAPDLLDGGELLLSTGAAWPDAPDAITAFIGRLAKVPIAGLVLELGSRFTVVPPTLVAACEFHGIPLIVLHRVTKFVAVTEAVHGRIIHRQTEALRVRDQLHELFIGLSLRGSTPDYIVTRLAQVLNAPVVLEDLSHRLVAAETLAAGDEVLAGWETTSRRLAASEGWSQVPVQARGVRWGRLIALPGEPHTAGREQVMEQAAIALAIGRLADRDADEWTRLGHEQLLNDLLGARYASAAGMAARLEAAGLAVGSGPLIGLAARPAASVDGVAALQTVARGLGDAVIVGMLPTGVAIAVVAASLSRIGDVALEQAARALAPGGASTDAVLAVGAPGSDLAGLLASLQEAIELVDSSGRARSAAVRVLRAERRPLLRLVTALADDPRLQEHSERMLRPLIEHDLDGHGDLLDVLRAFVTFPGNRTKAASASHLSRSVFYQRLALIEDLLDVDLDDGETVSALHAALLARAARR